MDKDKTTKNSSKTDTTSNKSTKASVPKKDTAPKVDTTPTKNTSKNKEVVKKDTKAPVKKKTTKKIDLEINNKVGKRRKGLSPSQIIILGFASIILVGSILLCLPIANSNLEWTNYIDALFTAASAVCVTGFTTVSVGVHYSFFGQLVILALIQSGGLGFMTVTTLVLLLIRKKIMFRDRLVLQNALGQDSNKGLLKLVTSIVIMTFTIELIGAVMLMPVFISDFGVGGIWQAIFLSISAFCNAGFDLLGTAGDLFPSLTGYISNTYVVLVVAGLIILGGIGFAVIMDVGRNKFNFKKFTLHSKIVLITTGALLLVGFIVFFFAEYSNPLTLGNESLHVKIVSSFFYSVTSRTAGFATFDVAGSSDITKLFGGLLMFIGTSPGSTGGGIKTTTFAVLTLSVVSGIRNKETIVVNNKSINSRTTYKAIAITFMAISLVTALSLFLMFSQKYFFSPEDIHLLCFENVLFDAISAFSTTGLSTGIMPLLSNSGKLAVIVTMFLGRVGLIPIGLLFTAEENQNIISYPEANIPIG